MAPGPLGTQSEAAAEAAVQRCLQRIVVIAAAAGFHIDLSEAITVFARNYCRSGNRICAHADDLVRDTPQKQVAALAAYVRNSQKSIAGQLLLHRGCVR